MHVRLEALGCEKSGRGLKALEDIGNALEAFITAEGGPSRTESATVHIAWWPG